MTSSICGTCFRTNQPCPRGGGTGGTNIRVTINRRANTRLRPCVDLGTHAHKDIAIQFCYWLSPTFQLYVVREFQRLNEERNTALEWDVRRLISKTNYHIHTDAVRQNLVPLINWNTRTEGFYFASEADVLNVVVFGLTAAQFRQAYPEIKGNLRDNASHEQLIVLANLEAINAELIRDGLWQDERARKLNQIAVYQMQILSELPALRQLPGTAG